MIRVPSIYANALWTKALWLIWVWIIPIIILAAIGYKVMASPDKLNLLIETAVVDWSWMMLSIVLLPLNILLEAKKWKVILGAIENSSLWICTKTILSGKSLNVISPFGIGDAFARIMAVPVRRRKSIIGGVLIDRVSQMLPTLILGLCSGYYLMRNGYDWSVQTILIPMGIGAMLMLSTVVLVNSYRGKLMAYLVLLKGLTLNIALYVASISFARFTVFALQFYFVFLSFGSESPAIVLWLGIGWIFFVKTIFPTLSILGDLVKRELSAILFFSFFAADMGIVIVASFTLWIINILVPSALGIFFIGDIKKRF
ncbi:MAG: lysylphosphatidylglycerol synthase domain-containing protein [Reichenbachiella sp.]|uniref:lysylphosphatidylglycerol synthase domain-containing protein n=1 Tax=Reichenbachiella sp. TaxID=2184521 RepID=UPI0032667F04